MLAVLDMSQNGLYFSKAGATWFQLYTLDFSMMLASNALGTLASRCAAISKPQVSYMLERFLLRGAL